MNTPIISVNEQNKLVMDKPSDSNIIYYTEVNEWFSNNAFRSFSLKFAINKTLFYKASDTEYTVPKDHFLLAAKQPFVSACGSSIDPIRSICIDISPNCLAEVFTILSAKQDFSFEDYTHHKFQYPEFYDAIYSINNTGVGKILNDVIPYITKAAVSEKTINREIFLTLVEEIVLLEYGNRLAMNGLVSVKNSTRKETLTRLKIARDYMDDSFLDNPEVATVATFCNMSEFHFFRCFRQAYGITPYQYLLKKRLEYSIELLQQKIAIQRIATFCGFADTSTYCKAFRRMFGFPPSKIFSQSRSFSEFALL